MKQIRHARADSFPLRPSEKHGVVKAINKRCSKDLQAAADGYCKFWVNNCTFIEHDVSKTPFPVMADVMYARFLLSHLRDVEELVNRWLKELNEGGMVFIEELEDITTESEVFRKYLKINDGLIASQGASLYVGTILAGGSYTTEVLCNECLTIPVANSQAASWFFPNTVTLWKEVQHVLDATSQEEREKISRELLRIKESNDTRRGITWKMRRLV